MEHLIKILPVLASLVSIPQYAVVVLYMIASLVIGYGMASKGYSFWRLLFVAFLLVFSFMLAMYLTSETR